MDVEIMKIMAEIMIEVEVEIKIDKKGAHYVSHKQPLPANIQEACTYWVALNSLAICDEDERDNGLDSI